MNTYGTSPSLIEKLSGRVKRPMSDFMQVFCHITFLVWLPLINGYADTIGARPDVQYVLTGMIIMAGFLLIRSLLLTLSGQKRMSFVELVLPLGMLLGIAAAVANLGPEIIDAATANPKMAILYGVGFFLTQSILNAGGGQRQATISMDYEIYECDHGYKAGAGSGEGKQKPSND